MGVERVDFNRVTKLDTPGVFTVEPDFKNPYTNRATLGFEREILPQISLGVDFTYADGHQLQRLTDINRVYDGTTSVNGLPHYSSVRPLSAYGSVITDLSDASAHYKAATAHPAAPYADNFSLYGAVTYSKDRDNDSNERNFSGIQAEDFNNLGLNWGPRPATRVEGRAQRRVGHPVVGHRHLRRLPLLLGLALHPASPTPTSTTTASPARTARRSTACISAATASASRTSTAWTCGSRRSSDRAGRPLGLRASASTARNHSEHGSSAPTTRSGARPRLRGRPSESRTPSAWPTFRGPSSSARGSSSRA